MDYRIIEKETYYRSGIYRHFTEDTHNSMSMTARIDVTDLKRKSDETGTKFYINCLYLIAAAINARDDYKMGYLAETDQLICYDVMNPVQYCFHPDTETCSPVYTRYYEDYETFYGQALADMEAAKQTHEYRPDREHHPNWFDTSFLPWVSYDAFVNEFPGEYPVYPPTVNWGRYRKEDGRLMMPVTIRLNHSVADGYMVAKFFLILEEKIAAFCME